MLHWLVNVHRWLGYINTYQSLFDDPFSSTFPPGSWENRKTSKVSFLSFRYRRQRKSRLLICSLDCVSHLLVSPGGVLKRAAQQKPDLSMATGEKQQWCHCCLVGYPRDAFLFFFSFFFFFFSNPWKHKAPGRAAAGRCLVTMVTNRHIRTHTRSHWSKRVSREMWKTAELLMRGHLHPGC